MAGYLNTDVVKEGTAFNRAEIDGAMKRQGIASIEKGDVVLFYTGWLKLIGKDNKRYEAGNPGLGVDGAKYLASLGVAIVGADNENLEAVPSRRMPAYSSPSDLTGSERDLHHRKSKPRRNGT